MKSNAGSREHVNVTQAEVGIKGQIQKEWKKKEFLLKIDGQQQDTFSFASRKLHVE